MQKPLNWLNVFGELKLLLHPQQETGGEAKASVVGKLYARHGGAEHKALWDMGCHGFESLGCRAMMGHDFFCAASWGEIMGPRSQGHINCSRIWSSCEAAIASCGGVRNFCRAHAKLLEYIEVGFLFQLITWFTCRQEAGGQGLLALLTTYSISYFLFIRCLIYTIFLRNLRGWSWTRAFGQGLFRSHLRCTEVCIRYPYMFLFQPSNACPPHGAGAGGPETRPEAAEAAEAPAVSLPSPPLPMVLDAFRAALQSVSVRNLGTLKLDVEKVRHRDMKRSEAWEHVETVTRWLCWLV